MRLFCVVWIFLCLSVRAEANYAWWVTYKLEPIDLEYEGIAVKQFDSRFKKLSVFNCGNKQQFSDEQCEEMRRNKVSFNAVGDFNSDGVVEHWHSAVAATENEYYQLLFALDSKGELLHSIGIKSDLPGFSALYVHRGKLSWAMCMECGSVADVVWQDGKWTLVWQADYG